MLFFSIYDEKITKLSRKTVSEQWRHQALVNAWPSWIDARRQYILLVKFFNAQLVRQCFSCMSAQYCTFQCMHNSCFADFCNNKLKQFVIYILKYITTISSTKMLNYFIQKLYWNHKGFYAKRVNAAVIEHFIY